MPNAKRVEQHNSFNVIAIASSLHKPPHSRQAQGHVSNKPNYVDQHTYAHINLAKTVGDCRRGRGWGRAERLRPDGCTTTNRKVGVRRRAHHSLPESKSKSEPPDPTSHKTTFSAGSRVQQCLTKRAENQV